MHGVHLTPKASKSVAVFDLDGTVIKSQFAGRKKVKGGGPHEWHWWRDVVPKKLKEAQESGMSVVLISNQAIKQLDDWKMKIPRLAKALPDVPFRIFAATAKDGYRKPIPGMWYELEKIFSAEGVEIDKSTSFYVGDAAGRADDFASTDRKFALNVGIRFYTPEEYFLKLPKAPYKLPGFNVSSLKPRAKPSEADIVPPSSKPEIVLFVGMPCLGKSSACRKYFSPKGYVHISQDALGSRAKCVKATEEALSRGKSCVIDNTNRDRSTRKFYIDLAKKLKTPVRGLVFEGSQELAWHNNLYRAYNLPPSVAEREASPLYSLIMTPVL
ncbi:hypothetical protein EWM64_g2825 [Hericium alpestre]|uniref:Polynucleotide kinase 3'-phosphatase n=1 Tax=Hericium alpestre TaxID=135208 RepID=A0A4Z0A2B8_9AGAM|nr:hypothetical protein EWM64_g2825 [Hericium alpestre]